MNSAKFKDPLFQLRHAGTVVAPWSLAHGVAGSNNLLKNIIFFAEFNKFNKNI